MYTHVRVCVCTWRCMRTVKLTVRAQEVHACTRTDQQTARAHTSTHSHTRHSESQRRGRLAGRGCSGRGPRARSAQSGHRRELPQLGGDRPTQPVDIKVPAAEARRGVTHARPRTHTPRARSRKLPRHGLRNRHAASHLAPSPYTPAPHAVPVQVYARVQSRCCIHVYYICTHSVTRTCA